MAQAMMTGVRGLEGALIPRVSSQKPSCRAPSVRVMATSESTTQSTRRAMIGLLATTVTLGTTANKALAEALPIKISQPPPTGKKATDLPDEARDLELPLKERFYLQPLDAAQAAARAKQSAMDIMNVKELIDKKAWPYVQNDLRGKASYLRYDLNTVINSKPKDQKKALKELTAKLFETMDKLDFAARNKSPDSAEKYYSETVTALNDVLAKLG